MANWNQPALTDTYANFLASVDARLDDLAYGLDPAITTVTNPPTNSIRWSSASNRWEKFVAGSWSALSANYAINISGNAATSTVLATARTINGVSFNGSANITITSSTTQSLTFSTGGGGAAGGTTFDGGTARTISYNSVGAPGIDGTNATGTWAIAISGNAATASVASALTSTLSVSAGGTGGTSFSANNVLLGNGSSSFQVVAPDTNGSVLTSNGTTWVSSPLQTFKNKIINGECIISQRGVASNSGANRYVRDRWYFSKSSSFNVSISPTSVGKSGFPRFSSSIVFQTTIADATVEANEVALCWQTIEGYNINELIGNTFTISFWVFSAKTGTHSIFLRGILSDHYVGTYTVNTAFTFEYKTITVTGGIPSNGNFLTNHLFGLRIGFVLACGSNYHTATPNTWVNSEVFAVAGAPNVFDAVGGSRFGFTGVQLEIGSVATQFERRPLSVETILCQRYYEKSYDLFTAEGAITSTGANRAVSISGNDFYTQGHTIFKVPKRVAPTMIAYSPTTGAPNFLNNNGTDRAATWNMSSENSAGIAGVGMAPGQGNTWHWTADAELG